MRRLGNPVTSLTLSLLLFSALSPTGLLAEPNVDRTQIDSPSGKRFVNNGNVMLEAIPEIPEELSRQLHRYQSIRSAGFQDFTPDGTSIYISTRFGQVNQLHQVAKPGGARRQLTFFPEPAGGFERQPGDGELLTFMMDEGGSEFFQIYLFDPRTGSHRRLTDGVSRNSSVQWSHDGKRIAYMSTRRNGRSNDLWMMEIDHPEKARMIVEARDGFFWGPSDWSRDGKRMLVQHYLSANDSRLYLLDLESGDLKPLAGSEERPSINLGGGFDASEQGLFFVTDQKSEFTQLAHLDLSTGEVKILTEDIPWNITGGTASEDKRRSAFTINEDGISRLYLMNAETGDYRQVEEVPIGVIGSLTFSPDARRLAMTLNTAKTPSDVFILEIGEDPLSAGQLTRWTWSEVGGLDTESFVEPELVHYPTFDTVDGERRRIPAFVYRPEGKGPHPVVINIHGGPEGQYRPAFNGQFQQMISTLGAAVIAPNVRGSAGYGKEYLKLDNGYLREDSVKDIGALLDWIKTQPDLDENRVAVMGGSYGGYMVLASLVHYSDRLQAGIDVVGISNFVTFLENTQGYRRDLRRVEYGDERDPEMRAFLERISPNENAEKITAPLLVIQGQNDPRVPVSEAEQIVRDVREAGYEVWYLNALNEGHGFRKKENRDLYSQVVMLFLEEHLADTKAPVVKGPVGP